MLRASLASDCDTRQPNDREQQQTQRCEAQGYFVGPNQSFSGCAAFHIHQPFKVTFGERGNLSSVALIRPEWS
jgi:hypothetical protein